jgi:hypothetical protein
MGQLRRDIVWKGLRENERRTSGTKFFPINYNLDVSLVSLRILRTTRQESSSDKIVHAFIVSCEVSGMRSGVDRWVRFIVFLAFTRRGKTPIA